ncbi:hypothetical protein AVEN_147888-1 [Araneus ventricosus]|uniref:Dynein heavy chain tail domain-containing protein n=1 Tax=Araneus ventricosus TaxID=182803 RepID=A0A4Y2TUG6_ARAVE|nr:hypothetical protein AVEN_147888-1 [Araneus ventricosus]
MFDTIDELSVLHECHAEGIEMHSSKLNFIVNAIKGKTYDLLDHRKIDFINDYKEFKNQIAELKENLQQYINKQFLNVKGVYRSILSLKR